MANASPSDGLEAHAASLVRIDVAYTRESRRLLAEQYPAYAQLLQDEFALAFTIALVMASVTQLRAKIGSGERFHQLSELAWRDLEAWHPGAERLIADWAEHVETLMALLERRNPDPSAVVTHSIAASGSWVLSRVADAPSAEDANQSAFALAIGHLIQHKAATYWDFPVR